MNKKIVKAIVDSLCIGSLMFLLWIGMSWMDVILHNLDSEPTYQFWNFFVIFFG